MIFQFVFLPNVDQSFVSYLSNKVAIPKPPPIPNVAIHADAFVLSNAVQSLATRIAPDAPYGCPNARAPPKIFNRFFGIPSIRTDAITCDANASFHSYKSMSENLSILHCNSQRTA